MRLYRTASLTCLLAFLLAAAAGAQPLQQTLPNGLRVVVERFPAAPVVAVRFYVHTGSVWEGRYAGCGISHLVEHCADHASAQFTAEQIKAARARLGEDTNAFTTQEATWYVYTTSADQVDEALRVMADYVLAPTLSTEAVEEEKATIQHEIQQDLDEPDRVIWDLFDATLFLRHPARLPIAGFPASLAALTAADVQAYHQARYAPENVVCAVVGDIDARQVMAEASKLLSAYPPRATLPTPLPAEPPMLVRRETVREKAGLERARLILGWHGVSLFSPDMYPLDLLAQILGYGDSARLVARLKYGEGLVDEIDADDATPSYDAGAFVVTATFAPEKSEEVRAAILREVRRVRDQGVTQAEVDRARQQMRAAKVFSQQTAEGRADSLGFNLLLTGDAEFVRHYLERMESVTPAQVQAAARRYLDPEVYALALLRPPAPAGREKLAGPALKEARSEKIALPNGLRVVVNSQPGSGALYVLSATLGGLRLDPPDQPGLSRFTGEMLTRGAAGRSRAQIAERLESRGASLDPFSGRNTVGLAGQALAKDADLLVGLWADCLRRPSFPEAEIDSVRQETLASLAQKEESTYAATDLLMRALLFPHHPYRWPSEGTAAAVKAFTRQDLLSAHRALFSPRQTVLVLAGDLSREQARSLAERYFGDWRGPTQAPAGPALDPPLTQRIDRTVSRDQAQAVVFYGWPGPRLTDPDLPVWNTLFGYLGGHSGLDPLFTPLRAAGLVYDAGAFVDPGLDPGDAVVYAATDPAKTADCRTRLEAVIRAVQQQPLTAEQLARTKNTLLTNQALLLADPAGRAREQALDELYGLGYDYYLGAAERVQKVTAERVQALAQQALALGRCAVVETRPGGDKQ